ncbi:UPF0182 family protein [Salinibacterium sp. SYSU T00001]|uniref:UPF0182 family membrane protein n=1 Tax=Homoserinimonas sedimenticola TaxID=2986805 RepID=UPI002235AB37|nr:UPF0182 family protein [Salinibacterium sedimenticola]MCW4386529.1 UPF0182 family protein [Salinibacterium sedimenticola]
MTSASAQTPATKRRSTLVITAVIIAAVVLLFFIFAGLYTDWLWFEQLGFESVLTTQWLASAALFAIGFLAMAIPVWLSIEIAFRRRPVYAKLNAQLDRYQQVVEPLRRLATFGIPIVFGFFAGIAAATRWEMALLWLNRTPTGETDPQFGLDISFYLFELPFYSGIVAFGSAVVIVSALAASYLYGAIRVNGREVRISKTARIQLAITGAVYLILQAVAFWLDQYATLSETSSGLLYGASYTDVNAVIPGKAILALAAAVVAVLFLITAVIGRWRLPIVGTALLVITAIIAGSVVPWVIQRFQVEPSVRSLEAPYLERNIEATRAAYGVSDVVETPYAATTDAEPGQLRGDAETTASIRILDPALVSDSFRQLEQIRQYYSFADHLDVDRYEIDGTLQDTVIAVREVDAANTGAGNSRYNETFVYTHGFGVVAAAGNERTADGMPQFIQSGIPSTGVLGEYEPRIYFGENSPAYSIVGAPEGAPEIELDYPAGGEDSDRNATTTYEGDGGPKLDNIFKQLVYAIKFQSEQIVLSDAVNSESQILYDRDPRERVRKVAPYLTLDSDPYPAVVDGKVLWIVDGYTTSAEYPYSDVQALSNAIVDTYTEEPLVALDEINYIRNSVKATVDAYSGEVTLYAWDDEDPVLATWQKIFPATVVPASEMSEQLLAHVRYPADLFKVQRAILGTYHVTDTNSFYSGDDAWVTPPEPTATAATAQAQPPYYLSMQLPGMEEPAFSLYSTYIPRSSGGEVARNVLTGYLAVNSDAGENYGEFTLLTLPKQDTVPGPGQVQNNFNSDPVVSRDLNILDQGSTTVERGNLLTLPVGGGLLYVQPVYVRSTGETSYPVLQKVLVSFGEEIAFEDSLDAALDSIFGGDSGADAGDEGVPTTPIDPSEPLVPTDPEEPTDPGTPGLSDFETALADAQNALEEREAAYAAGDRVAAAEADERLQDALERLFAASESE